jgi:membrane protease YdiL (CAAX protease family)
MLSAKPWKSEAVVRLLLSVFVCFFAGSVFVTALHHTHRSLKVNTRFVALAAVSLGLLATTLILMRKPWRFENSIRRVVAAVACFYAGVSLGAWAQQLAGPSPGSLSTAQMVVATLSFQGAALVLTVPFLRQNQMSWIEAFGFGNNWRQSVLLGLIGLCLFLPVGYALQRATIVLMENIPHFPFQPVEQQAIQTLRVAASWSDRLALGAITILLAPIAEEILFRGILYPWIKQAGFPHLAVWGTSLMFAAIHQNIVAFLPLLVLALMFIALYERTNNLLAPITAHASFNAVNFIMLYLFEKQVV